MELISKTFDQLTTSELYEILKARAEIFVVEQNCLYQDMDDIDYRSLHIFYWEDGKVHAYLRAFEQAPGGDVIRFGRVLTVRHGMGLGGKLLREAIRIIREETSARKLFIESQCHAIGFYEREGFCICSEEFMEVGIPHVAMELEL